MTTPYEASLPRNERKPDNQPLPLLVHQKHDPEIVVEYQDVIDG